MNKKLIGVAWSSRRVLIIQCDAFEIGWMDIIILACAVFFTFLAAILIISPAPLSDILSNQLTGIFPLMKKFLSVLSVGFPFYVGFISWKDVIIIQKIFSGPSNYMNEKMVKTLW